MLLLDGEMRIVAASRAFCSDFKLERVDGRLLSDLGGGEWNVPQLHSFLEVALAEGPEIEVYEMDLRRPAHKNRNLRLNAKKVGFGGFKSDRVLLTVDDVTAARCLAANNQILLDEKDELLREKEQMLRDRNMLLEEMRHRIANSLQIIASILIVKARGVQSEESRKHLQDAHDRVVSIAAIQNQLREGIIDLDVRPYLTKLCESLAASMIREYRPILLCVTAKAASVNPREAVSLGLVVTELVINALKHAFPDGRAGKVIVRYHHEGGDWLLSVEDDGIGMPTSELHVGLGTSMVAALANQMDAKISISNAAPGTTVTLTHTN